MLAVITAARLRLHRAPQHRSYAAYSFGSLEAGWEAIRAIYNLEVTESTVTFDLVPRSLDDQRAWLAARSGAHAAIVAERLPVVVFLTDGAVEVSLGKGAHPM